MYDLLSSLPDAEHPESPLAVIDDKTGKEFWGMKEGTEFGGKLTQPFVSPLKKGTSLVRGLTVQIANSEEEALHLLFEGETNRSISDHQLNKTSTRSHCIYTIHIESRSRVESSEKVTYSKLNLVDLAGSERLSKTQTSGVSLKEAMCRLKECRRALA